MTRSTIHISLLKSVFLLWLTLISIRSWSFGPPKSFLTARRKQWRSDSTASIISSKSSDAWGLYHTHRLHMASLERSGESTQQLLEESDTASPVSTVTPLPQHPDLVQGKLDNGFTYLILPNKVPPGRFEAHLEVLSGSVNELSSQQGMAHLLEHVAYMGSPKRQLIAGTGSRTNAYTDFHHTVFFAACPSQTPDVFWKKPMLPMALDALLDVMTTDIEEDRLEKERAAVLSEASMVNKMEYRVECQILSSLHSENRLSQRFPIGKEHLIKAWKKKDLQLYHSLHYRPDNVILFLVGDVDVSNAVSLIQQKFGHLSPKVDAEAIFKESGEFPDISMRQVNRHFPPVTHRWSCAEEKLAASKLPAELIRPKHLLAPPTSPSFTSPSSSSSSQAVATEEEKKKKEEKEKEEGEVSEPATTSNTTSASTSLSPLKDTVVRIFQHELLQSFSFHLFAKRPIEATTSEEALRREVMKRMILSALLIRLNVLQRSDPLFTLADFNQMNWVREGCAVCSLDITTDVSKWRKAVGLAIQEIRRMGLYGIAASELLRYKQSILGEASQMAVQSNQLSHEERLNELMECEACGHTYMHPIERFEVIERLLPDISLEEVNGMAREMCEHLSHLDADKGVSPSALIACAPLIDRQGTSFALTEEEVMEVVKEALTSPIEPLEETKVPTTLLEGEYLQEREKTLTPRFVPLEGKASLRENPTPTILPNQNKAGGVGSLGVSQKRLSNGIKVNLKSLSSEPQELHMRLYVPGGRLTEKGQTQPQHPTTSTSTTSTSNTAANPTTSSPHSQSPIGSVLLGARTMQEGGAFSRMSREEVELFCIDHAVGVEISATQEALIFDFHASTMVGKDRAVSGAEAIFQVAHIILSDFKWEEDAFQRAKQAYHEEFDSIIKGLETACQESLKYSLTQGDGRYLTPNHKQLDALALPSAQTAVTSLLTPANVEVSISGDLPLPAQEELVLRYFGTVPPRRAFSSSSQAASSTATAITPLEVVPFPRDALAVKALGKKQQLGVYLPDSDERAMGYLAGAAPNRWGLYADGDTVAAKMSEKTGGGAGKEEERRKHPLFGFVALAIVQEVANRRLFSVVREEKQLTYDASFNFEGGEAIPGGYYIVSVTSSPEKVQSAIRACKVALQSLKGSFGVMGDSVQSAKRSILSKFKAESLTNKFWVEHLAGTQVDHLPFKTLKSLADFESVVNSITVQDIQTLIDLLGFEEESMTVCVGIAAPQPPAEMAANPKIAGNAKSATSSSSNETPPPPPPSQGIPGRMSTATQLS